MDLAFTAEQELLRAAVREFAEREVRPRVAEYDRAERYPAEIVRKMAALGLTGGVLPPEYGGAGLDFVSFALVIEELARVDQAIAGHAARPSTLLGSAVLKYGTEEQRQCYLVPFVRAELRAGVAITEPHSGTDVAAIETTALRRGDDYVLNGAKIWVEADADWLLTLATVDKRLGKRGISAFIVEKSMPGTHVALIRNKLGFRAEVKGEISFSGCLVPRANLVGEEGGGMHVAMCAVETGRLNTSARACGLLQACVEASVSYARERIVFGQPIGRYQLIQAKITDMVVGSEAARLLLYKLAWLKDQGVPRAPLAASTAKLFSTDALLRAAIDACQIHGACACSDEYPVGRYLRDAKIFQIVEGTSELQRVLIAEMTLGYRAQ